MPCSSSDLSVNGQYSGQDTVRAFPRLTRFYSGVHIPSIFVRKNITYPIKNVLSLFSSGSGLRFIHLSSRTKLEASQISNAILISEPRLKQNFYFQNQSYVFVVCLPIIEKVHHQATPRKCVLLVCSPLVLTRRDMKRSRLRCTKCAEFHIRMLFREGRVQFCVLLLTMHETKYKEKEWIHVRVCS